MNEKQTDFSNQNFIALVNLLREISLLEAEGNKTCGNKYKFYEKRLCF